MSIYSSDTPYAPVFFRVVLEATEAILNEDVMGVWLNLFSELFVTRYANKYYINFQGLLVVKDRAGNRLSNDQLDRVDCCEIKYYPYLWEKMIFDL